MDAPPGYEDGAIEKIGSHRAAGPYTGGKYSVYEGGTRMIQYLNYVGYNALVVSVLSGGSTILPEHLPPNRRRR